MEPASLKRYFPLLKGSIGETRFKCGKYNCVCTHGVLHTAHYLSYRLAGKTHTLHIPKALVFSVMRMCRNWRDFNKALEAESHQSIGAMIRSYKTRKKGKRKE